MKCTWVYIIYIFQRKSFKLKFVYNINKCLMYLKIPGENLDITIYAL